MRPIADTSSGQMPARPEAASRLEGMSFEQAATAVLGRLQHAIAELLTAAPEEIRKAADVERVFGIDHRLGWQVYRIANARTPLAAGTQVPARVSMDRLVKVAERKGVPEPIISEAAAAFDEFESLVRQHAGSRTEFDALLSSALPEEQDRINLASRESLYHAARTIRGASMRISLFTHIVHPSADAPDSLDGCNLMGNFGLQRIRRGATIETSAVFSELPGSKLRTIDGKTISESTDIRLSQFCSSPAPRIAVRQGPHRARFVLEGEDVGIKAAVDSVFADYLPAGRSRFATPDRPFIGAAHAPDAPAGRQVVDLLVCDGVAPAQNPVALIYDIVPHGQLTKLPDPDRELDRVAFQPEVRALGRGLTNFRCLHMPRYQEMLSHVFGARGWDPSRFHGYRVEIEYPVYSWQTVLTLRLPDR